MKWSVGCCNGRDNYLASHELVGWKPRVILEADTLEDACREYVRRCEEKRKEKRWIVVKDGDEVLCVSMVMEDRNQVRCTESKVEAETIEEAITKATGGELCECPYCGGSHVKPPDEPVPPRGVPAEVVDAVRKTKYALPFKVGDKVRIVGEFINYNPEAESDIGKVGEIVEFSGGFPCVKVRQHNGLFMHLRFRPESLELVEGV